MAQTAKVSGITMRPSSTFQVSRTRVLLPSRREQKRTHCDPPIADDDYFRDVSLFTSNSDSLKRSRER